MLRPNNHCEQTEAFCVATSKPYQTTKKRLPQDFDVDEPLTEFLDDVSPSVPNNPKEDEHTSALMHRGEYMRWHYKLGHLSNMKMRALIFLRLLPQYLLTVNPPICTSCKAGSMTKRPWRDRGIKNKRQIKVVNKPGHCVSVDQIESQTPGFCGVLRGFITKRRYTFVTIFTDHYSRFSYIHL